MKGTEAEKRSLDKGENGILFLSEPFKEHKWNPFSWKGWGGGVRAANGRLPSNQRGRDSLPLWE